VRYGQAKWYLEQNAGLVIADGFKIKEKIKFRPVQVTIKTKFIAPRTLTLMKVK
jgi:hypothetical protein